MRPIAGVWRFIYSLAVEQRRNWSRPGPRFSFAEQGRTLTALRREVDWLRGCPVLARRSISVRAGVWIAVLGWRRQMSAPALSTLQTVGTDRGADVALALTDGAMRVGPRLYAAALHRLGFLQRGPARNTKGFASRRKQKGHIARLHARVARIRYDWLREERTMIVQTRGGVLLEDLRAPAMSRSARASVGVPCRNVRQKAGRRGILDQDWNGAAASCVCRLAARGGFLIAICPAYNSQTCAACGDFAKESQRTHAAFQRVACGHEDHAEPSAAKNILRRGAPWSGRVEGLPVENPAVERAAGAGTIRRAA